MDKDTIRGPMEENTRANMLTIKKRAMVCTHTQTVDATKECGRTESSMEKEFSLVQKTWQGKVNGRMENACTGLMKTMSL